MDSSPTKFDLSQTVKYNEHTVPL